MQQRIQRLENENKLLRNTSQLQQEMLESLSKGDGNKPLSTLDTENEEKLESLDTLAKETNEKADQLEELAMCFDNSDVSLDEDS